MDTAREHDASSEHDAHEGDSLLYEIWGILKIFLVSLAIVLPVRYFIAQPFIVRGASMEPTFEDREYLVIDELSYYLRSPKRGEVIVFRYPRDTTQFFIKRIVGLPGDTVTIRDGRIAIANPQYPEGFTLPESYLDPPRPTRPDVTVTLGEDEYFLLGDNRDFSSDSRIWGPLKDRLIIGRVVFRAWPIGRFGLAPGGAVAY